MSFDNVRNRVQGYVQGLFNPTNQEFAFFKGGNSTVLSTSFAIQVLFLIDKLHEYPITDIGIALRKQQDPTSGLFVDRNFDMRQIDYFDEEYILWQFTFFVTIALDMLNQHPDYEFSFLKNIKDERALECWLLDNMSKGFWYMSNKLMFLFYFLIFEQEKRGADNQSLIQQLFRFLDSTQDLETGFWGKQNGTSLEHSMFGAAHIYQFYDFFGRDIYCKEAILDHTLALQNTYGLFGSRFGGACEDFDAVEICCMLTKHSSYKSDLVRKAVQKTYARINNNQNRDGGFPYAIDTRSRTEKLWGVIMRSSKPYYRYSEWKRMESQSFKSDIWGTYFRVLTTAKIVRMLDGNGSSKCNFYPLPGWGYY